jgi:hypothetical protein
MNLSVDVFPTFPKEYIKSKTRTSKIGLVPSVLKCCYEINSNQKILGPPVQTGPEAHPASCTMGTGSFSEIRCGHGVTLTSHPLLVPRSKIE